MNTRAPTVTEFAKRDPDELTQQLADTIACQLRDAIAARDHAMLAVSGGKPPIAPLAGKHG